MKKLFTLSLLCLMAALLLPSMAEAQQRKVVKTTPGMKARPVKPAWEQNRNLFQTPLNRALNSDGTGTTLYGTVIYSDLWEEESEYGVYAIPVQSNTTLSKVYGDYQFHINGAAVYHNGCYYLMKGEDYGQGIESVTCYVYEAEEWEQTDELELPANWFAADMSVDPTSNTVYGLCASYDGGQELAILDFDSQQRSTVGKLSKDFVAIAIDASGIAYGISTEGTLFRISTDDASLTEVGPTGLTPEFVQSATFDWATGKLYWAATTDASVGALYEVDLTSGTASQVSRFNGNEEIVGLYSLSSGSPWEGPDVPTPPQNVALSYADGVMQLSWTAPTAGLHNGELDPDALTYTVTRYPDNVVVADHLAATSFSEVYASESLKAVYYTVVAHNGDLTGEVAQSNYIAVGDAVDLPYRPDMTDEAANSLFSVIDGDMDGSTWSFNAQSGKALLYGAPFEFTNDYLVTPRMRLDADHVYRLSFKTACDWAGNYPYSVAAYAGLGSGEEDLQQELLNRQRIGDNGEQVFEQLFRVEENGAYHIGLRVYGYDIQNITLYDICVEEGPALAAPDSVTALRATTSGLDAVVRLEFNAPAASIGGDALSALSHVLVYRNGELIATLEAQPGQALSFTDEQASMGQNNTYRVVAVNEAGEGLPAVAVIWVGSDAPTEPLHVSLTETDGKAVLSWQAPVVGQNGGFIEPSTLRYAVLRSLDNEVVAANLSETSYEEQIDQTMPQQLLYYGVQAANELGYSTVARSNAIVVGAPYGLPFYEGFENGSRANFWTAENYNENGWGASWGGYADAQDADGNGGFIAFGTSGGYQNSGSRLFSGKISLKGADNPILEYAYCHRSESQGERHPLKVYVIKNGTDTVLVKENEPIFFYEINTNDPFYHERVSLADFMDADYIQLMFDAVMDETTYTYLDAVQVRNYADYDLAVTVSAPESVAAGENISVTMTVKNVGAKLSSGAMAYLKDVQSGDIRVIGVQEVPDLMPDSVATLTFEWPVNTLYDAFHLFGDVYYSDDNLTKISQSPQVDVTVALPLFPAPTDFAAEMNNDESVSLSWQAPSYEDFVLPFTEDVESYEAFNVAADLGEWTVLDADGLPTHDDIYAEDVHVEYEGMGQPSSWLVFNPIDRNYPTESWWGGGNGWNPVSGKQFFASISVKEGTSDDWLISPELTGEAQTVSFFEHGYYSMEHFEVLYSTSGRNTEDFTLLASETASFDWTQRSYDLPEGARYFAIRNVSDGNSYRLFVDDVHFRPASGRGVLQMAENGYNLYRDGELLTTLPASATSYVDHPVRNENLHVVYHVTALYNLGESAADEAEVFFTEGIKDATVRTTAPEGVYSVDGRRLTAPVRGLNIIRQADGSVKKVFRR